MTILVCINEQDLEVKIFDKPLLAYNISKLNKEELVFFTKYDSVKKNLPNLKFLSETSLQKAITKIAKATNETYFVVLTKLGISNIDLPKIVKYHINHGKSVTVVCRNLVPGKTTPIYKLNDNKEVVAINRKRYANCGLFILNSCLDFSNFRTLSGFIESLIDKKQVKAFVYNGFFYTNRKAKQDRILPKGITYTKRTTPKGFKVENKSHKEKSNVVN